MASTNKTPQLGLNQWAAGDEVLRTDFNADNGKIDAAVGRGSCIIGTYTGNGAANRVFDLGFKPKMVFVFGRHGPIYGLAFLMWPRSYYLRDSIFSMDANKVELTETGFRIIDPEYLNPDGGPAVYVAFY